ncbi:coatomer epsilon subunit-domain-containing protein [Exophiala viscosa]|uniref:Coatomer subunit epsilon n=1 Tax=Exophiala viscosa TaxID=2486360 RepID=A0AAN6IAP1_9EURO|nr:coatomer epsilon subunit-domain-containing protein [Exophiala viscosa]
MDPFSGEGELLNITTAFHTHAYQAVLDFDTSALSPENKSTAQILKYRAQIALGESSQVISSLKSAKDAPSRSLLALAQQDTSAASSLAESDPEDPAVQICAGTVLAAAGDYSTAIDLLTKHQGSLEAVALLVQIHLLQNRTDLAVKEVQTAKRWAQDSLLINLAESWTNLREGGTEKYQSAFYVYEELASTPGTTSPTALVGQAVAELHLGRTEEAEAALQHAVASENADVQAIANSIVLASVVGKKSEIVQGLIEQLREKDREHAFLKDLEEKSQAFDVAASKYSAKAAA